MYNLIILGAGESGVGAALLAKKQGISVFVSDLSAIKQPFLEELIAKEIPFENGNHNLDIILNANEIIKSPGIPEKSAVIKAIREKEIPIISEIAFAARFTDARIIGITGTNGKTTTTSIVYDILKRGGLDVAIGGNIGTSFARLVSKHNYTHYVLEISSFQLDDIQSRIFDMAVLTNITPDHLDRYNYNIEEYMSAKMRIIQGMSSEQVFVYNQDDELTIKAIEKYGNIKATILTFSQKETLLQGAWLENNNIVFKVKNNYMQIKTTDFGLKGKHNRYNNMAAGVIGLVENIRKESIRESLTMFDSLEHRLETIATIGGVEYINDSKATNVNSTWYALESMQGPLIWIAGGIDKGNDYNLLKPLIKNRVKAIVCLGLDNLRIHEAFAEEVDLIVNTTSMEECIKMCQHIAQKGDKVLLSPACASFDLFQNYEDRGRQFRHFVKQL